MSEEERTDEQSVSSGNLMDSKTSHLDDLLNEKLESALHKQTSQVQLHEIARIVSEHNPIDLAHAVSRLPSHARPAVYDNLPNLDAKATFLVETGRNSRQTIFREITDQEMGQILEALPPDESVWLLDDVTDRRAHRVLAQMDPVKATRILELQQHERNSAGRLMTNEFFAFHMNRSIGEVASTIRDKPGVDLTRRIFVLNDSEELIGYVPGRNLIVNPSDLPLKQVMQPVSHSVTPDDPREEVVEQVARYKIPALPVLNEEGKLLGVITYEDVVEAMEDMEDSTMSKIAGTVEDVSEDEPILKRMLYRSPWLIVTLFAGLVTATGMSHFKEAAWFAVIPFFISLITGMSGNVGIQCSTIIVRAMATGEISPGSKWDVVKRELTLGSLIGIVFGLCCGLFVYWFNEIGIQRVGVESFTVGAIVAAGVVGACWTATCLGVLSPFLFAYLRIDPAVAAGPIVTAFNDVLSMFMYFFVAHVVMNLLQFVY